VRAPLVVIGDALLDRDVEGTVERLSPDAPVPVLDESASRVRPGGAALAAALAAADGRDVTLVTALARDAAGAEVAAALEDAGVNVIDLGLEGRTPEKVRFMSAGRPLLRLDRGGREPGRVRPSSAAARAAVEWGTAVLVSDYGRGVTSDPGLREALRGAAARTPVVWDPHPRGAAPVPGVCVASPNERELATFVAGGGDGSVAAVAAGAAELRGRWHAQYVCVTRGAAGALLVGRTDAPLAVPAERVPSPDPCGAGDRFASTLAGALADGSAPAEAVMGAVLSASAFVSAGGARSAFRRARPSEPSAESAFELARRVKASGGSVVATGGCFDLLHPGHIATLRAARALGDCLIVLVNSDESVRRLKGPARPLVPQQDRAAVLGALRCVDAVLVFDEDTPEPLLERLRPDVWAKGGDHAADELPEAAAVARGGGRTVVLPYLDGLSTTRLIEEAAHGA
jgi:D-beta-D-heptose 7-phosphate kinase / D-beta-D-heptose 1-phosphate adenosyltransferase